MAGGKIVRIAGGKIIEQYETLTYYQKNFTINAGGKIELTTDAEMIYGEPKEPTTGGKYIIRGWWSSDNQGKEKIEKAYLGDIVYFHIETQNIPVYDEKNDEKDPDLSKLYISFYDIQLGWMGVDFIVWDREMKGAVEHTYVDSKNRAYTAIKILCNETTINMVKDDDTPGDLEIYCRVEYRPKSLKSGFNEGPVFQRENLPVMFNDYLRVKLPPIPDLYYIKPDVNYQFPEIRSSEGNAIYMELLIKQEDYTQQRIDKATEKITGVAKGKLIEQGKKGVEYALDKINKYSYTLAIRELEKGSLMYTDGRVIQRKNVYDTDITMIDGNLRNIKRASNTGFRIAHPTMQGETYYATTKGLNQLEVFAQKNPIHTAANLGMKVFETLGFVIDVQGMEQSMATGTPDYKGLGSLVLKKFFGFFPSWVGRTAGYLAIPVALMVDQYSEELEELIEDEAFNEFLKEKEKGMKSMESFLNTGKPNKNLIEERIIELGFRFLRISSPTLQKLLAKEFNTFKELDDFESSLGEKRDLLHGIVVRGIWNQNYIRHDSFIYCIFINEEDLN